MNVILDHTEDIAKNIKTFWFKPERPMRNIAGQFTELYLPHEHADNRGQRRWFTISSSPTEDMVSITTKFFGEQASTFKKTLFALQPGAPLKLADPMGDFVLPKDTSTPLVFVAGGIGVTPMRSMVKWLLDTREKRSIHLIYAANKLEDVAFEPLFRQYGLKLTTVIKEPPAGYEGESGQLDADRILTIAGDDDKSLIYLSGPEPMTEALTKGLKAKGVNKHRLVTDYFPGYQVF
jgi:ferredoxin-NADP reductase